MYAASSVGVRLQNLISGAIALPPLVEFSSDAEPAKTLYLAFSPFTVAGIFEDRASALASLSPFLSALESDGKVPPVPTGPHHFQPPMGLESIRMTGALLNYVEAACIALILPKHRKQLTAGEALTPAADYVKAKTLPRVPGVDFKELIVAGRSGQFVSLMRMKW